MLQKQVLVLLSLLLLLVSCNNDKLPVYGEKRAVVTIDNTIDSADYQLPQFAYLDQDSNLVNGGTIANKIFVTEFFFTSCPSICPKMQAQMLRVYEKYKTNPDVQILAWTIDPVRDTIGKLKSYEKKLGIESSKWHLLTGEKDSIYSLAESFLVSAAEDPDAPGGHIHSGNFILVDRESRIRGYYDGTDEKSVQKLLDEIDILQQDEED